MASSLGLELECDGVENAEQAEFLKQNGVQFASGPLWGEPMAPQEFIKNL